MTGGASTQQSGTHSHPRVGVGVVVFKGEAVLLVRRGKPPALGQWSIPGGSQELGETLAAAAVREVMEETGVECRPLGVITAVDNIVRDADGQVAFHYTIVDLAADWVAGEPVAATDVTDARWARPEEWCRLVTWGPLLAVLETARAARRGDHGAIQPTAPLA